MYTLCSEGPRSPRETLEPAQKLTPGQKIFYRYFLEEHTDLRKQLPVRSEGGFSAPCHADTVSLGGAPGFSGWFSSLFPLISGLELTCSNLCAVQGGHGNVTLELRHKRAMEIPQELSALNCPVYCTTIKEMSMRNVAALLDSQKKLGHRWIHLARDCYRLRGSRDCQATISRVQYRCCSCPYYAFYCVIWLSECSGSDVCVETAVRFGCDHY